MLEFVLNSDIPKPSRIRRESLISHESSSTSKSDSRRDFKLVQEMKTYYPTEEEFMNPISYVEKLYKEGVHKYG